MSYPDPPVRTAAQGQGLAVIFVRAWQNYYPGDVATFPARMSWGLVSRRVARMVDIAEKGGGVPEGAPLAMRGPGKERPMLRQGEAPIEGFDF